LDRLPFPARDLIDIERYRQAWRSKHGFFALSIIASRGCPFRCNWCAKPVFGRLYHQRSPSHVVDELVILQREFRPDRLRIVDDIFPLNKKWLKAWHAAVLERQAVIPFECLSRVDLVDVPTLRLLKEAGCWKICYGAESGSQRVLDAMDKGIRVEETYRAAAAMREVGIRTYFFIMLGYPGEEWSDIELTRKLLRETLPDEFSVSVAYPLPGTKFYEQVRDRLGDRQDWAYSSENAVLFRHGRYGTRFYRLVERLLHREVEVERARRGLAVVSPIRRLRLELTLLVVRCLVQLLRLVASRPVALRPVTT
jgi:anaerobic magnesium-protoporphyrin IX monomethyl ester cyclase